MLGSWLVTPHKCYASQAGKREYLTLPGACVLQIHHIQEAPEA